MEKTSITKLLNELREMGINESFEDDTVANDAVVDDNIDTGISDEPVLNPEDSRDEYLADIMERLVDMDGEQLKTVLDNMDEVGGEEQVDGIEDLGNGDPETPEVPVTGPEDSVMAESTVEEEFEVVSEGEPEAFETHGIYTVSNSGGYEIMLSPAGDAAKVKDAFGSDNPEISDWLEIEYVPSEDSETLEMDAVIDPNGYNIPLNQVMRVNMHEEDIEENMIKKLAVNYMANKAGEELANLEEDEVNEKHKNEDKPRHTLEMLPAVNEMAPEVKKHILTGMMECSECKETMLEHWMSEGFLMMAEDMGTLEEQLDTLMEDDIMLEDMFNSIAECGNEDLMEQMAFVYDKSFVDKMEKTDSLNEEKDGPCWKGYKQVGMKEKDGKEVPNCVPEDEVNEEEGEEGSWMATRAGADGVVFEGEIPKYTAKKGINVDQENGRNTEDYVKQAMEKVDTSQETEQEKVEDFIEKKYEKPEEAVGETDVHRGKSPMDVDFDIEPSDAWKERTELEMTTGDSRERNEEEVGGKANIGGQKGDPYTVGMDGKEREETSSKVGELEVEKMKKRKEHRDDEIMYKKDPQPVVNEDIAMMKKLIGYKFDDGKQKENVTETFNKNLNMLKEQ